MPSFHRVCAAGEIPPGKMRRFEVDETPICVYNCGGTLTATHDTCSHAEASLAEGFLDCEAGAVECPLHGARFDVRSGKALSLPAVSPVKVFAVKVEDGAVLVRV
jgi:3-phenylpropionate/trans-cinnamate dioxygenase ferredoxin subunit